MVKGLLLFAFILWCADFCAQQYPFVYYTPKDGLVNSRVRKMYQDSKGRLYFITYGGLSVYDGARFRNYTMQNGLATDMVNDVVEAGEDSLLVATNTTKLNVLVRGQMRDFQSDNNFFPIVNQFLKSSDGNIYATADEGLFKIGEHHFEALSFGMASPDIPPFLGNIVEVGDKFIIGTNDLRGFKGLFLYDKKNRRLFDTRPELSIGTFAVDKEGSVWINGPESITMLDAKSLEQGKLKIIPLPDYYKHIAGFTGVFFAFDGTHTWLVSQGRELIRAGKDGSLLHLIRYKQGQSDLGRVFIDKENIVWVCSSGSGVFKLVNTTLQVNDPLQEQNITGNINYTYYTPDTTWYLLNNEKVVRQTNEGYQVFTTNIPSPFYSVAQTGSELYFTTYQQFYKAPIPSSTTKKISVSLMQSLKDTMSYRGLVVRDQNGIIIVAQKDSIAVFKNNSLLGQYLIGKYDLIEGMKFDQHNRLWIAGRYSGITIFTTHPEDPGHYLKLAYHFKKELGSASPRCMVLDKNDRVWIGTRSEGLLAFVLENDQLKQILHLQGRQGMTDDFITALACDSSNNILAGTQTGLDRIIVNNNLEYRIENITKRNNIFGYIFYLWVDKQHRAFAVLTNGSVLQIAPVQQTTDKYAPNLFIEEIKINGTLFHTGIKNPRLPYTQRNLSFNMAAPAFVDEQQVQYSYMLQGSGNDEWSEPSENADFNFLNLSPGRYTLEVRASFPSTDYPIRYTSYTFTILPPWWQTWWFRILAVVLFVGIVVVAIRLYYRRKLEKQKTVLEKQQAVEKERTRIATDMHDDLGAGLSRIKFLSETIGIKKQQQEPIEEDIGKIRQYSHDMIDKMGEIVWALNEKNDSISDLVSYTRAYASEYLSQNGIRCSIDDPDQLPAIFVSGEFRRNIFLTVKEALHNIVKHSQATETSISFHADNKLTIIISDNGNGIIDKKTRTSGNGLVNMKKRIESLGGTWTLSENKGITIKLIAPLPL